jgi:hypothetical protein
MIHKGAQRVTKDTKGHKGSHSTTKLYQTISNHPIPKPYLYSREDPRPLVTASSAIMIVIHSAKVSTLHPRVVISSPVGD